MKFNVEINGHKDIAVDQSMIDSAELLLPSGNGFNFRYQGKNYHINFINNPQGKLVSIEHKGQVYHITIQDGLDQLIKEMGLDEISNVFSGEIHSPMPGLVVEILVKEGQKVEKGEDLVILEAMKMENIIKAEGAGVVDKIYISKLDKVEKSQILISLS